MKIIKINKCFDECPHISGPDHNPKTKRWQYTCQEIPEWLENEHIIPDWCPLEEEELIPQLVRTIEDLLEALGAPFPDSCDCGGSSVCAVCNAYRTLKKLSKEK